MRDADMESVPSASAAGLRRRLSDTLQIVRSDPPAHAGGTDLIADGLAPPELPAQLPCRRNEKLRGR